MDSNGKTFVVSEVLAANKSADVALLRLRDAKLTPLPLAVRAPVGTAVSVISHPDGRYFTMTKGDVSRYFVARSKTGQANRMAITADYAKGSSGAPVLDSTGAVVGMVSATNSIYYSKVKGHNENLQMVVKSCVPVDAIHRLLR
jgi:S1-C subfamily serine protease